MLHDLDVRLEVGDDWSEVRRACEEYVGDGSHVSVDNLINSVDAWSLLISVQGEAMLNGIDAKVSRDTTEAKDWEVLIATEWLDMTNNTSQKDDV